MSVRVPNLRRDVQVRIASHPREWEQAFRLLAENYGARGYDAPGGDLRFTACHALPDTVVLVALEGERVVATLSLVADNTLLGLPLARIYGVELAELQQRGRRVYEVSSLADRGLGLRDFVQVFLTLIRLTCQYILANGGDTAAIVVNPRHRDFYTKTLGYVPLGPRRAYASVQGHPAEGYFTNPGLIRAKSEQLYQRLIGDELPAEALTAQPMPVPWVRHFSRRSSLTPPQLVEDVLQHVETAGSPRRW